MYLVLICNRIHLSQHPPARSGEPEKFRNDNKKPSITTSSSDKRPSSRDERSSRSPLSRHKGGGDRDRTSDRDRASDRRGDRHDDRSAGDRGRGSTSQPALVKAPQNDKDPLKLSGQKTSIKLTLVNKVSHWVALFAKKKKGLEPQPIKLCYAFANKMLI